MNKISKDILFNDFVNILQAYFKHEHQYVKSLLVNRERKKEQGAAEGRHQRGRTDFKEDSKRRERHYFASKFSTLWWMMLRMVVEN